MDLVRIAVYGFASPTVLEIAKNNQSGVQVLVAAVSPVLDSYLGKRLLKKITLRHTEWSVAVMMAAIGIDIGQADGLL